MEKDVFQQFENGVLVHAEQQTRIMECLWNSHKDFPGVFLKNVVTTDHTAGLFTSYLVRIEPNCKIGLHSHPGSIEMHEVIKGYGRCIANNIEIAYYPGTVSIINHNTPHEVHAGNEGLFLFAKFVTVPT